MTKQTESQDTENQIREQLVGLMDDTSKNEGMIEARESLFRFQKLINAVKAIRHHKDFKGLNDAQFLHEYLIHAMFLAYISAPSPKEAEEVIKGCMVFASRVADTPTMQSYKQVEREKHFGKE